MLYTDGLSESRNGAGEMLGEKGMLRVFAETARRTNTAANGLQGLLDGLAAHGGPATLADDRTLIFIRHIA